MSNATKIHHGMERQLQQWRQALAAGDQRLGWKIGFNRRVDQQKFALPSPMIGYLTAKRRLAAGGRYTFKAGATILLEAEIALLIGHDVAAGATPTEAGNAIQGYAAALELVDTSRTRSNDIAEILAGNLFHEAVLIGNATTISNNHFNAALKINGNEVRRLEPDRLPDDFGAIVKVVADILGEHGEQLQAGDWIISGAATTPIEIHAGDAIALALDPLGNLTLTATGGD
jgi:2-keto-4-pentenoate hydratase